MKKSRVAISSVHYNQKSKGFGTLDNKISTNEGRFSEVTGSLAAGGAGVLVVESSVSVDLKGQ